MAITSREKRIAGLAWTSGASGKTIDAMKEQVTACDKAGAFNMDGEFLAAWLEEYEQSQPRLETPEQEDGA